MPDEKPRLEGVLPTMSSGDLPLIITPVTNPLLASLAGDEAELEIAPDIPSILSSSSMPDFLDQDEEWVQFDVAGDTAKQPEDGEQMTES
jgi:hypothetical protein